MENIEKYIFDPKDPKKCRVYKLLLQIVKEKNFVTMLSPLFYLQLFSEELEKRFEDEIWDKPDNYELLNIDEKVELYIKQNSINDLFRENYTAEEKFKTFNQIFENLVDAVNNRSAFLPYSDFNTREYHSYLHNLYRQPFSFHATDISNSLISFIDQYNAGQIHNRPAQKSVLIIEETDLDDWLWHYYDGGIEPSHNQSITNIMPQNTHPLILKNRSDLIILIDYLKSDLKSADLKKQAAENSSNEIHYLNSLQVDNYFCIEDLKIENLKDKKEIYFLGENGDGKTLVLQSILLGLKGIESGMVGDYLGTEKDSAAVRLSFDDNYTYSLEKGSLKITDGFKGSNKEKTSDITDRPKHKSNIYAYGIGRNRNDSEQRDESGYLTLFSSDLYLYSPVRWLLDLDYIQLKGEMNSSISLTVAKEMISDILNKNVKIDVTDNKVIFTERGTKLEFHQLAEGYKSVLIWLCDLVQRLSESQPEVTLLQDYKATVLVDEIGLHLHPKWEYSIVGKLRGWFPNIQFIFTTHSPTVILGSSKDAVFFKLYKENGVTKVSQPLDSVKNFMANTILTSPLFNNETANAVNCTPSEVDTSDDYFYTIIHRTIREQVAEKSDITEDKLKELIEIALNDEYDEYDECDDECDDA